MTQRPPDRVLGVGMVFPCRIGFLPLELHILQDVVVDFEVETDWRAAAALDAPEGLVDYAEVHRRLGARIAAGRWQLIERLAEDLAEEILRGFPVSQVRIRVTKHPLDLPRVGAVAVECTRRLADLADR